jgi:hypothetical protein
MGAGELWSDMVHRRCADAIDVDNLSTEFLVYAASNLGNKVAVSGYTDAALGRTKTKSPGDHRIYANASEFTYKAIINSIRQRQTFATNGGPVFAFLSVSDAVGGRVTATIEVQSLHALDSVELLANGAVIKTLDVTGELPLRAEVTVPVSTSGGQWILLRARDKHRNWAVTSPVHLREVGPLPAAAALLEINNTARGMQLRKQFHAHAIVSVSPELGLIRVVIQRDGKDWQSFAPSAPMKKRMITPVTAFGDSYAAGFVFVHEEGRAIHFQADWPVTESGWYALAGKTSDGRVIAADAVYFDAESTVSHELSSARLVGPRTELVLHGYGEEMPLAEITLPFEGDHWWYPANAYSMMTGTFAGHSYKEGPWGKAEDTRRFKAVPDAAAKFGKTE